jgi:mannose-6-phosphate isomerase-like protein (cupin superfamily)
LLEAADPEREFGMHRTETIDILYIVSGAMDLILETGKTSLASGDAVVQLGTWHSWSNPYSEPCVAIVTMLRRIGQPSSGRS